MNVNATLKNPGDRTGLSLSRTDFAPNMIWSFEYPDHREFNPRLAKFIREERERYPQSRECAGRNLWQGPREFNHEPLVQPLFASVFEAARSIAGFLNWDLEGLEPKIQVCWANIHGKGSFHTRHVHPASVQLSGVYYVEAPPNCGDIVFHDLARFLGLWGAAPRAREQNAFNRSQLAISPKAGLCLLFPAYLMHEVEANYCGGDRLGLAFNINFE